MMYMGLKVLFKRLYIGYNMYSLVMDEGGTEFDIDYLGLFYFFILDKTVHSHKMSAHCMDKTNLNEPKKIDTASINLVGTSVEVGLILAIPLVIFVIIGVKLDTLFDTKPLFILVSMAFAALLSSLTIWRKVRRLQ